ncbi:MAG TPA: BCAM0308 family protein [Casimicrobiaceae bacterium]|nr:BCAM0308 family protein [Casimicrobiaceae bacterium]
MIKQPPSSHAVHRNRDRILDSRRHDPYQSRGKLAEPTVCETCRAVYKHGRWRWGDAPPESHLAICPACQRIRDDAPAGNVVVEGDFVRSHASELINTIRNAADHERLEHPLHRIVRLDQGSGRILASTTDIHLPQRIGEALKRAYDGELDVEYGHDAYSVRVRWRR